MRISPIVARSPLELRAVLRKITEVLAEELACPSLSCPAWSDEEWILATAVAAMHGISPILARTLRWQGPAHWVNFLDMQRLHTEQRHTRILEFLHRIDAGLRRRSIAAVALKGVALHAMDLYQPGERPMADVDLLVHPQDAQRTARLLDSLGMYESAVSWKERVFTPRASRKVSDLGEHTHNDMKIELHERICEMLPSRITDVSDLIFPTAPQPGLNAYPSTASLMIHLLLHAAGAMTCQSLRLLHLRDLALLCSRMTDVDWAQLLGRRTPGRPLWWALPPLQLTARYYSLTIPPGVLATLRGDCPPLLRRVSRRHVVSDVSFSYPLIDAFPGVAWSQSMGEMATLVANRLRPNEAHLALRRTNVRTQAWVASAPWTHLSQTRRMLRWVRSRPLRPVTLHALNAAWAASR